MDRDTGSYPIRITQFINPHLFWLKRTSHDGDQRLAELELDLQAAMSLPCPPRDRCAGHMPRLNDTVAVKHLAWQNKWLRARVDELLGDTEAPKYVLWIVDHGWVNTYILCNVLK